MNSFDGQRFEILLIEDNEGDAKLLEIAFGQCGFLVNLHTVVDGEGALDFLSRLDGAFPDLILLDLNLPRMHGWDFLKHIKTRFGVLKSKVVILTGMKSTADHERTFGSLVDGYLAKPIDFEGFVFIANDLCDFLRGAKPLPVKISP